MGSGTVDLFSYFSRVERNSEADSLVELADGFAEVARHRHCDCRGELFTEILRTDARSKSIALIHTGGPGFDSIDPAALRTVETIRRSPTLGVLCRPVCVGYADSTTARRAAQAAGAFGFVTTKQLHEEESFGAFLTAITARVPRVVSRTPGSFFTLELNDDTTVSDRFADAFVRVFGIEPGPHDSSILECWASELPEKVLVDAVESDADSGWSGSSVARRIEKLRDCSPVVYRDNSGNLAKSRLARDLLSEAIIDLDGSPRVAALPDIDRCAELAGDDQFMRRTFLDDDARLAFISVVNRRVIELSTGGGRPKAGARTAQLESEIAAAFRESMARRFRSERMFRDALARALYAIADTQFDLRRSAA